MANITVHGLSTNKIYAQVHNSPYYTHVYAQRTESELGERGKQVLAMIRAGNYPSNQGPVQILSWMNNVNEIHHARVADLIEDAKKYDVMRKTQFKNPLLNIVTLGLPLAVCLLAEHDQNGWLILPDSFCKGEIPAAVPQRADDEEKQPVVAQAGGIQ